VMPIQLAKTRSLDRAPFGSDADLSTITQSKALKDKFAKFSKVIQVDVHSPLYSNRPYECDPRKHFRSQAKCDFKKYEFKDRTTLNSLGVAVSFTDAQRLSMTHLSIPKSISRCSTAAT